MPAPSAPQPEHPDASGLQRRLFAWTLLACVLLCGAMAVPYFLGHVPTSDDLWAFHLPVRQFYAECLAEGDAFDWMPSLYCGFYLTGEGQAGTYHPLHMALYSWLPLRAAFNLELLLSYPLMLAGTYFFLRRQVGRRDAALLGGMVFTFSGFNVLHYVHPNAVAVVAHLPWLLLSIDVACRGRSRVRVVAAEAAVVLLTASQLLLGYPQYVWYSLLAELAWFAWLLRGGQATRATGLRLAALVCVGAAVGGVQLLPTIDALGTSQRNEAGAEFFATGGLHVLNLVQLAGPYLLESRTLGGNTHEFGMYFGAAPLLLIVWLLPGWKRLGRRRFVAAALGFALLAFVLALGKPGGLYLLQTWLPLVGKFRLPARYLVLVHLCLAAVTAVAFAELARRTADRPAGEEPRSVRPLWQIVGFSGVLAALAGLAWSPHVASLPLALAGPALLAAAAGLIALAQRGAGLALPALVLFTAADLGVYGFSYAVYQNTHSLPAALGTIPAPPSDSPGRIATDLRGPEDRRLRAGNQMTLRGWRQVDGYAGLEPARRLDYRQLPALRAAGVRLVHRSAAAEPLEGLQPGPSEWAVVPKPLPRAWLVARAVVSDDPARDIGGIDLESTALVERPVELWEGPPGEARVVSDRPGEVQLATTAATRQLLVLAERYHHGWQAALDGAPCPVERTNGDFLGCAVPPGEHRVEFAFRPASLRRGKALSCIGLVVLAACCVGRLALFGNRPSDSCSTPGSMASDE